MNFKKKELIILGIIIVVLFAYLIFKSSDRMHYKVPTLEKLKSETIEKISISKADNEIILVKKNNKWFIEPKSYPTDIERVNKMVETISNFSLSDLASRSKNYPLYELDKDKGIRITAFSKDGEIRYFEVGKAANTYSHTFVKLKDDDNIYYARESFRDLFDAKMDDLRNKSVMKVDINEVSDIEIEKDGTIMRFTKKAESASAVDNKNKAKDTTPVYDWILPDGKKGAKSVIDGILDQISEVICQQYVDEKNISTVIAQTPIFTLKVKGRKDYTLTFYPKVGKLPGEQDAEEKYPVVSSESPYPFYLASWKAEQIIKNPTDMIEKPAAAKAPMQVSPLNNK